MKHILALFLGGFFSVNVWSQRTIHGTVLSVATGEPVAGATIQRADSSLSVSCDERGKFSIQLPANDSLLISAVGYELKKMLPAAKDNMTILLSPM